MPNNKLKKKKIGIIGLNGQADRIIKIIKKIPRVELSKIYYHKKQKFQKLKILTNNLNDLFDLDGIIVSSPTFTHYDYLKKLRNYKGYLLIEKPIVSKKEQSKKLLKYPENWRKKTLINYNFNHSVLFYELKKILKIKKFGKPVNVLISTNHGLAFKKNNNWRFEEKKCRGVGEMNTCHFIKFATDLFGEIDKFSRYENNYAKNNLKKNFDTVNLSLITKKKVFVNIFNSYATPFMNYMKIFFTNCIVLYDGEKLTIHYPRDVFDKNNRYKFPPKIKVKNLKFSKMWDDSLHESINYFLNHVKKSKNFNLNNFKSSVEAIYPIID